MTRYLKTLTLFFGISLIALLGIIVPSIIIKLLFSNCSLLIDYVARFGLLFSPFIIAVAIIDRICVRIFGVRKINRIEIYIMGTILLLFLFYRMFIFFSEL